MFEHDYLNEPGDKYRLSTTERILLTMWNRPDYNMQNGQPTKKNRVSTSPPPTVNQRTGGGSGVGGLLFWMMASMFIMCISCFGQDASWNEVQWSKHLAESIHAESEHVLPDGSRIDIYQPGVCAWEVEWCHNWEQAFGQAAFYAASTDTVPGIWILKRGKEDDEDWLRFLTTLQFYRSMGVRIKWQVTEVGR